ncbi:hypothetical protein H4R27_001094 [Coemansia aciculifera]|nr:hypothetical protein H4R27_001094 [Coemansia aciculifera]
MTVHLERDFALRDSPTVSGSKIEDAVKAANICIHSYGGHLATFPDFDEKDDSLLDRENYTAHNFVRLTLDYTHTGERYEWCARMSIYDKVIHAVVVINTVTWQAHHQV